MAVAGLLSLLAVSAVFVAGMALLSAVSPALASSQETAPDRVVKSLRKVAVILAGEGRPFLRERLHEALGVYAVVGLLVLLPLGRRLFRGLVLLLLSSPPLLAVLVVSSGIYQFTYMLWPPRFAAVLALVLACLAFASVADPAAPEEAGPRPLALRIGLKVACSWGLQLLLLPYFNYSPWPRLNAVQLLDGRQCRIAAIPKEELRLLRCLAARLPAGMPVSAVGDLHPVFHRQSIVFPEYPHAGHHPSRLRVIRASDVTPARDETTCRGPRAGTLAVEGDCDLMPRLADCARAPEP